MSIKFVTLLISCVIIMNGCQAKYSKDLVANATIFPIVSYSDTLICDGAKIYTESWCNSELQQRSCIKTDLHIEPLDKKALIIPLPSISPEQQQLFKETSYMVLVDRNGRKHKKKINHTLKGVMTYGESWSPNTLTCKISSNLKTPAILTIEYIYDPLDRFYEEINGSPTSMPVGVFFDGTFVPKLILDSIALAENNLTIQREIRGDGKKVSANGVWNLKAKNFY